MVEDMQSGACGESHTLHVSGTEKVIRELLK